MIDIENMVFDRFYNSLIVLYPNANITGGYDEERASVLTVIIREVNNAPLQKTATDDCVENHARVTYEIEVVTDQTSTGRSLCRQVMSDVDDIAQTMKFRRIHMNRPINIDRTKWRQYARYEVIVGKPQEIDGNTVYQMYRR